MAGIVSYGAFLPRLRLSRMAVFNAMGWMTPAIMAVAQGERTLCNWDEDTLTMAVAAGKDCLKGMDKQKVDAVYMASTTMPFADRQNAGILSTALNLSEEAATVDVTGSQRAGTTALSTALAVLKSGEKKNILVTASDARQARAGYFYDMWMGDAAASVLIGEDDVVAEYLGGYSMSVDFVDHYRGSMKNYDYNWEERWMRDEGYAKIIPRAVNRALENAGLEIDEITKAAYPCFFNREHKGIAKKMGLPPEKLHPNMHELTGETGVAHPLVMLVSCLEQAGPGDKILVAGFGQGSDAMVFQVTDAIKSLPRRSGVKGSLERKKVLENYPKYLKFRDLIETEMGIRAEADTKTALSVLWRKRKIILGLVGGKCTKCGTPQFPKSDICVNPDCHAVHAQEDYEFADKTATIKSFTGDMLAVSVDPPSIYGLVQFDEGGRLLADFTDCDLEGLKVGQSARMTFRKRFYDPDRGFTGYFWKAAPEV